MTPFELKKVAKFAEVICFYSQRKRCNSWNCIHIRNDISDFERETLTRVKFEDIEFQQLLNENQTQAQKKLAEQFGMTGESIGVQEDIIIDKFSKSIEII